MQSMAGTPVCPCSCDSVLALPARNPPSVVAPVGTLVRKQGDAQSSTVTTVLKLPSKRCVASCGRVQGAATLRPRYREGWLRQRRSSTRQELATRYCSHPIAQNLIFEAFHCYRPWHVCLVGSEVYRLSSCPCPASAGMPLAGEAATCAELQPRLGSRSSRSFPPPF